jgi:hypothetical protein
MSIHVEPWAPEYGSPLELDDELGFDPEDIDDEAEVAGHWEPIRRPATPVPVVAFVDGVRRPDARLALDDGPEAPVPGLCGSYGVGAVLWHTDGAPAEFHQLSVERIVVCGDGQTIQLPLVGPGLEYRPMSVPGTAPRLLIEAFHNAMRVAEADLAEDLARGGYFVVADGPLNRLTPVPQVGMIKSHRTSYLPEARNHIIGELDAGERSPIFGIPNYERYSWYLRLADVLGGHSWSGVVRCEVSAAHGIEAAINFSNLTTTLLPEAASERHRDARAPQNLVPIAGLERELRRRLGVSPFLQRMIIEAVAA